jgi:preprotein translocase subunit YajC
MLNNISLSQISLGQIFISDSFAQEVATTAATNPEFSLSSFVPLIAIFAVFYFLIVRPQSKKMKEHQNLVNNLKSGNKVITNGGIIGVVKDVDQKEGLVEVEIAEGVTVKILKQYVADLLVKPEVKEKAHKEKKSKK